MPIARQRVWKAAVIREQRRVIRAQEVLIEWLLKRLQRERRKDADGPRAE